MAASGLCPSLHPCLTHSDRTGGADGPWVRAPRTLGGAPRTLGGAPRTPTLLPQRGGWWDQPVSGPTWHGTQSPPLSPTPAGAARPARAVRARVALVTLYKQCGPPGVRRGPALPQAPPPTPAGARGLAAPGGLLCRGARRPGASYPPPTGVCAHGTGHRRPLGGTTPPPTSSPRPQERGNSPGHRPPPGRGKVPTARLILAPHSLFIVIPLGCPGPQSPRRVSSWGRNLRTSVTETQVVVSHPADVGSLRPHGTPGHPGHPSRG